MSVGNFGDLNPAVQRLTVSCSNSSSSLAKRRNRPSRRKSRVRPPLLWSQHSHSGEARPSRRRAATTPSLLPHHHCSGQAPPPPPTSSPSPPLVSPAAANARSRRRLPAADRSNSALPEP